MVVDHIGELVCPHGIGEGLGDFKHELDGTNRLDWEVILLEDSPRGGLPELWRGLLPMGIVGDAPIDHLSGPSLDLDGPRGGMVVGPITDGPGGVREGLRGLPTSQDEGPQSHALMVDQAAVDSLLRRGLKAMAPKEDPVEETLPGPMVKGVTPGGGTPGVESSLSEDLLNGLEVGWSLKIYDIRACHTSFLSLK